MKYGVLIQLLPTFVRQLDNLKGIKADNINGELYEGYNSRFSKSTPGIQQKIRCRTRFFYSYEYFFDMSRDRGSSAQLGRAGISQTHPLQQARQRRPLCGLGTTSTLFRRGSRRLQTTAQLIIYPDSAHGTNTDNWNYI
jgi:hypothetical protein